MTMLFVPKEIRAGERRVAASPESVKKLIKAGLEVAVESGAGREAGFSDEAYSSAGATLVASAAAGFQAAEIVFKVAPPEKIEAEQLRAGTYLFSLLDPYRNTELVQTLAARKVTVFAMELVPRTTRGQAIDVLSSQASIAGYKAVLVGAERLGKIFPLLMTAAGTIQPAKVVVLGAGVAGLMALATAKRLGATVEVSDVRPAVKEQVESLGGRFIDLPQMPTAEGRRRLRQGGLQGVPRAAARDPQDATRGRRRGDHHRPGARQARPDSPHPRDDRGDEAGLGGGRHRRRAGRQLRADPGRRGGRAPWACSFSDRRTCRRPCRPTRASSMRATS